MRFYIKDNILYSTNKENIKIYNIEKLSETSYEGSDFFTNNKAIITKINEIIETPKEISVCSQIKNFDSIKNQIKNLDKKNIKKVKKNDYEFIEITNSLEIFEMLKDNLKFSEKYKKCKNVLEEYLQEVKNLEKVKEDKFNLEIGELKLNIKNKKNEIDKYKEKNIFKIEKKLKEKERVREKINLNISNLNNEIKLNLNEKNPKELEEKLKEKEKIEKDIDSKEFEILLIKGKNEILEKKIQLGKIKSPNVILMILTLGLIYWTKFSNIKYQIINNELKITKIKEKKLRNDVKLKKISKEIDNLNSIIKEKSKSTKTKNDILTKKISELEIEDKNNTDEIKTITSELKPHYEEIEKINSEIEKINFNITIVEDLKSNYMKNSSKEIERKIGKIENLQKQELEKADNLSKSISNQKIKLKGDLIITM